MTLGTLLRHKALRGALTAVSLAACGTTPSNGGGVVYSGGMPGSPCATVAQVGCLVSQSGTLLVRCTDGVWQQVGQCTSNQYCVESAGTAGCIDFGGADTGGSVAGDAETGSDASAATDAVQDSEGPSDADTVCGNGTCEVGENNLECPQDCTTPKCGNGACEAGETPASCVKDCGNNCPGGTSCPCVSDFDCKIGVCHTSGSNKKSCPQECVEACPTDWTCTEVQNVNGDFVNVCVSKSGYVCGDGKCSSKENADTCAKDCKASTICGDGTCSGDETPANCPQDCQEAVVCGDGTCGSGETPANCLIDCPAVCGDGTCTPPETNATCAADCPAVCGNGLCEGGETVSNCAKDCVGKCGNLVCEFGETPALCSKDCKPGVCDDKICSSTENIENCPIDCIAGTSGCKGRCGMVSKTAAGGVCFCDAACEKSGDCCSDYQQFCTGPGIPGGGGCTPNCTGKTCGSNGCGGSCGTCPSGTVCDATSNCKATVCGDGVCEGSENPTSCLKDCPSQHPCDQGGVCGTTLTGGGCYCDAACKAKKDCCTLFGGKASTCIGAICKACK